MFGPVFWKNNLNDCQMNNAVYKQAYRKSFVHYMGPFIMKKTPPSYDLFFELSNKLKYFIHLYQKRK